MYLLLVKRTYSSLTCAINLGSSVILTGGLNSRRTVTEYNEAGWVRDLPVLCQKRYNHGCSYYDNNEGTKVDIYNLHIQS